MNVHHLAVFHAVAEEGNLTRAAARLFVSQPAVSRQLRELERSLGTVLFHRLSTGVRLTEAGELLAVYARQIFALEGEAETALVELRELQRGRLRVGASTTIGAYLLPKVFARFSAEHPGIELHLEIFNTDEIQRRLAENTLDLGLSEGFVEAPNLTAEVFGGDEIVVIAPPQHRLAAQKKVTLESLRDESFIWREAGSGTRAVAQRALQERGVSLSQTMTLGNTEAVKRAVIEGAGLAFVSRLAIEIEIKSGALRVLALHDFSIQRPLHRLKLRGKYESRATRAFVRLLRDSNF